jgi:hypothetical protein
MQPKKIFVRLLMPNKDLGKYDKGASSLPMKAKGKAPFFFLFFAHFLLHQEILEEVKNKIIYFWGRGGILKKSYRKINLRKIKQQLEDQIN